MEKVVLVDFDGTITKLDTCDAMVREFARDGWQYYEKLWENGEISTEQCAIEISKLMDVDEEKLINLLNGIEIDEYFIDFLNFCRSYGYKVVITSDGYDFNIKTVLKRYGIEIEYYSNKMWFEDGKASVQFMNANGSCRKCGMCKRDILNQFKDEGVYIIYIGDGYSDLCVAKYADEIFAKRVLKKYCEENGIPHIPFENFNDVINKLKR